MTRGRTAVVALWLSIVAVLAVGAVVATTRDGAVEVVSEQGCVPDTIPAPSSPEAPPKTAGVPCVPFPGVVATTTTTTPSADSDLALPPGDYDRVTVLKEEYDFGARGRAAAQRFATPPEMVALMGPSGLVQLSGTFP